MMDLWFRIISEVLQTPKKLTKKLADFACPQLYLKKNKDPISAFMDPCTNPDSMVVDFSCSHVKWILPEVWSILAAKAG
jgi:hypothetical protein